MGGGEIRFQFHGIYFFSRNNLYYLLLKFPFSSILERRRSCIENSKFEDRVKLHVDRLSKTIKRAKDLKILEY